MPEQRSGGMRGGQPSDLNDGRWREQPEARKDRLDRDREKQRGGIGREPGLNPDSQRQERHISD